MFLEKGSTTDIYLCYIPRRHNASHQRPPVRHLRRPPRRGAALPSHAAPALHTRRITPILQAIDSITFPQGPAPAPLLPPPTNALAAPPLCSPVFLRRQPQCAALVRRPFLTSRAYFLTWPVPTVSAQSRSSSSSCAGAKASTVRTPSSHGMGSTCTSWDLRILSSRRTSLRASRLSATTATVVATAKHGRSCGGYSIPRLVLAAVAAEAQTISY